MERSAKRPGFCQVHHLLASHRRRSECPRRARSNHCRRRRLCSPLGRTTDTNQTCQTSDVMSSMSVETVEPIRLDLNTAPVLNESALARALQITKLSELVKYPGQDAPLLTAQL